MFYKVDSTFHLEEFKVDSVISQFLELKMNVELKGKDKIIFHTAEKTLQKPYTKLLFTLKHSKTLIFFPF